MNAKSKTLLSVVVMTLMLGCALFSANPLDSENVAADDAQTDEMENFSIFDSLMNMDELGLLGQEHFFMPVESSASVPTELEEEITGATDVTEVVTFKNGGEYEFSDDGKLTIQSTGTLVLFPLDETDVSFSIFNNYASSEDIIVMSPGSKISIFDMTFQLISSDDFVLMSASSDSYCVFSFERDNSSGDFEFKVTADESWMTFAELIYFDVDLEYSDIIVVSGNLMPISEETGIVFSGSISLSELDDNDIWCYPYNVKFTVENLSFGYVPDSYSAVVDLSVSVYTNNRIRLLNDRISIEGGAFEINDASVEFTVSDGSITVKLLSSCSVSLRLNSCSFDDHIGNFRISLSAASLAIELCVDVSSPEYIFGDSDTPLMELDGKISLTFVNSYIALTYKNYDASMAFSGEFNLDSIKFAYTDRDNWSLTIGETELSGTLSSMRIGYTVPKNIISKFGFNNMRFATPQFQYDIESTTVVTNIEVAKSESTGPESVTTTVGFDEFKSEFATVGGSSDWKGEIAIEDLLVTLIKTSGPDENEEEPNIVDIGKLSLTNNIPMQQLFSESIIFSSDPRIDLGLPSDFLCLPTIDLEVNGFFYSDTSLGFEKGFIKIKEYRGLEEFVINLEGEEEDEYVGITLISMTSDDYNSYSLLFDAPKIYGSVKNPGDENDFTISGNDDSSNDSNPSIGFRLFEILDGEAEWVTDAINIGICVEIANGDATFEGGSLPFYIDVDDGADFSAPHGLTAFGFAFGDNSEIDGKVSIDTDAELPLFHSKEKSFIIGESYALVFETNGYVVTLDLSKLAEGTTEGTIVANNGYILPKTFTEGDFSLESSDQKNGTFTVDNVIGATVSEMRFKGEKYRLTCGSTSEVYEYGTSVTLSMDAPVKKDMEFFGWSDGIVIYKPFDDFVMPSHDVVLKPIFVKNVSPVRTVEGSKVVLVAEAPNADMIKINIGNTTWDILKVTVGNTTFVIDEKSYGGQSSSRSILLQSTVTDPSVFSDGKGNMTYYNFRFYTIDKDDFTGKDILDPFTYSGKTVFGTTINMKIDGDVKDFKVYEVGYNGDLVEVDGATFVKRNDGTYDVSFNITHAAYYAVEPVYEYSISYLVIIGIVLLVCAIGLGYYLIQRRQSN